MEGLAFLLPHGEDYDQHYVTARQIRTLPDYECREDLKTIEINDPTWGECLIGDRVGDEIFLDLYTHPLVQRTAGIEQLTLPRHFATMPGSVDLFRWEHIWGSVVFVRKMVEKAEAEGRHFDPRQVVVWQLRTFVSDLGHTAYSHLGDWLFQGYGGTEDHHDKELMDFLEMGGINDLLRHYNFEPEEIVFPDINDWIEQPSPDLCVDRVDYGAREMGRWVTGYEPAGMWVDRFSLSADAQHIVMKNQAEARKFALGFGLLATEHWGHPVHRLQLHFFGELVKSIVADEEQRSIHWWDVHHPRDLLYTIDYDINASTRAVGELNFDLFGVMLDMARAQRKIFAYGRETELESFLSINSNLKYDENSSFPEEKNFPHPLEARHWTTRYTDVKPTNLAFIPVNTSDEISDFDQLPYTLDVFLPALKPRSVDPLYRDQSGNIVRLSETDPHFNRLIEQQRSIQKQAYVARLYADPAVLERLKSKIAQVNNIWQRKLTLERAAPEVLRDKLEHIGALAIGSRRINIRWYD